MKNDASEGGIHTESEPPGYEDTSELSIFGSNGNGKGGVTKDTRAIYESMAKSIPGWTTQIYVRSAELRYGLKGRQNSPRGDFRIFQTIAV